MKEPNTKCEIKKNWVLIMTVLELYFLEILFGKTVKGHSILDCITGTILLVTSFTSEISSY